MSIEAGKLDKRIGLFQPQHLTDPKGVTATTLVHVGDVWAQVRTQTGREIERNGLLEQQTTYYVRIRYRNDITTEWELRYSGKRLHIAKILDVGEKREELEILATAVT